MSIEASLSPNPTQDHHTIGLVLLGNKPQYQQKDNGFRKRAKFFKHPHELQDRNYPVLSGIQPVIAGLAEPAPIWEYRRIDLF
jgi:hypothetical protein